MNQSNKLNQYKTRNETYITWQHRHKLKINNDAFAPLGITVINSGIIYVFVLVLETTR